MAPPTPGDDLSISRTDSENYSFTIVSAHFYAGMGSPRTVFDLEDSSRTKSRGLGLEGSGLGLGLEHSVLGTHPCFFGRPPFYARCVLMYNALCIMLLLWRREVFRVLRRIIEIFISACEMDKRKCARWVSIDWRRVEHAVRLNASNQKQRN